MYKTLFLSILSTIFIGCSSTTALKHFKKDELEAKAMQYTKKADVIINEEQKVLLWATYLNNIDVKEFESKEETFLTSVYFVNKDNQELGINGYSFSLSLDVSKPKNEKTLNINDNKKEISNSIPKSQKPISIEEISKDNELYKNILSKNTWGKYYLVKFKKIKESDKLILNLSNANANSAKLTFEK